MARQVYGKGCTWTGNTNSSWSNGNNWSKSMGASCNPPSSTDDVVFNTGSNPCTIDATSTVLSLSVSGYTGTISQNASTSVTVLGDLTQTSGTFNAAGRVSVAGQFNATGGTFNGTGGRLSLTSASDKTFNSNSSQLGDLYINDSLVAYWKLDDGAGGTAADSSGSGNDGTLTNATWNTTASALPSLSFADASCLELSSSNSSYVSFPAAGFPVFDGKQTVSFWVYYASVPSTEQAFLSLWGGGNQYVIGFRNDGSGNYVIQFWRLNTASVTPILTAATTPASGWHHIVYAYDNVSPKTHYLYVDGVATTSIAGALSGSITQLYLGARPISGVFGSYFTGRVDDVRVYNRLLTATELNGLFLGNQPGGGAATQTLSGTPTINGDLVLASGSLAAGSTALTVKGNWANYGGVFSGTGIITLSATGSRTIRSAGQPFAGLTTSGTGSWTLEDGVNLTNGTLTIGSGTTVDLSGWTSRFGSISNSGTLNSSSATVILEGRSNPTLGASTFGTLRIEDPRESSLVGYWKLDALQGTRFSDFSGNGNTGTLTNNPSWSTSSPLTWTASGTKYLNPGYVTFAGGSTADYGRVTVGSGATTNLSLNPASGITVAYWFKVEATPSSSADMVTIQNGTASMLETGWVKGASGPCTGICIGAWNQSGSTDPRAYSTASPSLNAWHHFAYTYNSADGRSRLYVDGSPANGTALSKTPTSFTAQNVYISTYDGTNGKFTGSIDDVRIYSTPLTDAQVAALYAGRYAGTGGTGTTTLTGDLTVNGRLALDSGTLAASSRNITTGNSDPSQIAYVNTGTISGTTGTLTFKGGLSVGGSGALTLTGAAAMLVGTSSAAKSFTMDGTLTSSSTSGAATIQAASASYPFTFTVGSSASATPILNIGALAVKYTDASGMNVNAQTGSATTFTAFNNLAFSNGTGNYLLQIGSSSPLSLTAQGLTFDTTANKAIGLAAGSSSITASIGACCTGGSATCTSRTATSGTVSVSWLYTCYRESEGAIEGFPTAAFDWNTFTYYATYVAYRNANGTLSRIYVRQNDGSSANYYWEAGAGVGDVIGTPRWTQITSNGVTTRYVYVATTGGRVYRLVDTGSALSPDASSPWNGTPYCYDNGDGNGCTGDTITSPLTVDSTFVYWVGTDGSGNRKFFALTHATKALYGTQTVGSDVSAAPAISTLSGTRYLFLGMSGYVYKLELPANAPTTWTQDDAQALGYAAAINGRLVVWNNLVYGNDNRGTVFALDATTLNMSNNPKYDWKYQDTATHGGGCSDGGSCAVQSAYVDLPTGHVMYGDRDGHIYVVYKNGSGGTVATGYPIQPASGEAITTAPLYVNGFMVVGTNSGSLFVINRRTQSSGSWAPTWTTYKLGVAATAVSYNSNADAFVVGTASGSLVQIPASTDTDCCR